MGTSVTVALAPGRAVLASGRAVAMTSFAVVLAPVTATPWWRSHLRRKFTRPGDILSGCPGIVAE
jgi:hypothetical protein